jgi:hypothetical protein
MNWTDVLSIFDKGCKKKCRTCGRRHSAPSCARSRLSEIRRDNKRSGKKKIEKKMEEEKENKKKKRRWPGSLFWRNIRVFSFFFLHLYYYYYYYLHFQRSGAHDAFNFGYTNVCRRPIAAAARTRRAPATRFTRSSHQPPGGSHDRRTQKKTNRPAATAGRTIFVPVCTDGAGKRSTHTRT